MKNQSTVDMEINQVVTKTESEMLSCTKQDAKCVCFPTEVDTHRKLM